MTLRPAQEEDFAALTALYEEFHAFHVRGVPTRLRLPDAADDPAARVEATAQIRTQLEALVGDPHTTLLCAEADGRIVGLAEVYLRRDEPHPLIHQYTYGYLQSLMVTERWRGHSVGRELIAAAEAWAREHGATQLRLSAWEFAGGPVPFYEALGYQTMKRELMKPLE
jgi:GNAT superfamily N-acetyltransferase